MEFVDTHCHIHFKNYPLPASQVLANATKSSVNKMICVGTSLEDSHRAIGFATKHDNVWSSAGAHPHDGQDFLDDPQAASKLKELLKEDRVVAVGEIGLDYYHDQTARSAQAKALRSQIEAGLESGLPFIFHVRDAWADFWPIFDEYKIKRGVVHSFSAGVKQLDTILNRGLYVGLNGIMTFTRDEAQLQAAKAVPLERLLLETDAPFLTPAVDRGKTCEPKHVRDIAQFLSELRGETLGQIAQKTTANATNLFNLS